MSSPASARPYLLLDGLHVGQRQYLPADAATECQHLVQRGPGDRARRLYYEMPLTKVGHEGPAKKRHDRGTRDERDDDDRQRKAQPPVDSLERAALPVLEPYQPAGFGPYPHRLLTSGHTRPV